VKRAQEKQPLGLLSCLRSYFRRLNAVIDRVPHQVGQWIFDGLDDGLVEFGVLPLHFDPHLLAAPVRHVAHRTRELAPDIADRLHARLHHALLQFRSKQVQPLTGREQFAVFGGVGVLHDLVAQKNQFRPRGS
jgi:hypothetical protein